MERIPVLAIAVIAVSALQAACSSPIPSVEEEREVVATLTTFLRAFENGDVDVMEASFAEGSSTFPRAIMANEINSPIQSTDYRRVRGLDPQMRELIARWQEGPRSPPYITLEPKDLEVQMFTDAAVVTFHLEYGSSLSRRTFVLAKEEGSWKIVHLHASNVVGSE